MHMLKKIFGYSDRTVAAGVELETAAEGLAATVKEINACLRASFGLDDVAEATEPPALAESSVKGRRTKFVV